MEHTPRHESNISREKQKPVKKRTDKAGSLLCGYNPLVPTGLKVH